MIYKNKNGQPRERCMIAAYSLSRDFGASQAKIADVMECSQSTVSAWIKEAEHQKSMSMLTAELADAREYVEDLATELNYNQAHIEQVQQEINNDLHNEYLEDNN